MPLEPGRTERARLFSFYTVSSELSDALPPRRQLAQAPPPPWTHDSERLRINPLQSELLPARVLERRRLADRARLLRTVREAGDARLLVVAVVDGVVRPGTCSRRLSHSFLYGALYIGFRKPVRSKELAKKGIKGRSVTRSVYRTSFTSAGLHSSRAVLWVIECSAPAPPPPSSSPSPPHPPAPLLPLPPPPPG